MVRQSYLPGGGFLAGNGVGGCPPIRPALGLGDAGQLRAVRRRPVTNRPLLPGGHPVDSRRMRPVRGIPAVWERVLPTPLCRNVRPAG